MARAFRLALFHHSHLHGITLKEDFAIITVTTIITYIRIQAARQLVLIIQELKTGIDSVITVLILLNTFITVITPAQIPVTKIICHTPMVLQIIVFSPASFMELLIISYTKMALVSQLVKPILRRHFIKQATGNAAILVRPLNISIKMEHAVHIVKLTSIPTLN